MTHQNMALSPVDEIEILTLMDNYSDILLPSQNPVTRAALAKSSEIPTNTLLAEHGLSQLITTRCDGEQCRILFDTGYSPVGVPHNLELLGVKLDDVEAIVLSHGHMDHTGSLETVLKSMQRSIPLVVHPEAFHGPRYLEVGEQKMFFPQTLDENALTHLGAEMVWSKEPVPLFHNRLLVTGQVERSVPFEKGFPGARLVRNGNDEPDPILDDQAMVAHLKGKGLVVISGCAHAGIVNTIQYAQKITDVETVYGVIGGFHLSGAAFEPIIEKTIDELKKLDLKVIVPMHCTGWKAIKRFSQAFPSSFLLNSVGSRFVLN